VLFQSRPDRYIPPVKLPMMYRHNQSSIKIDKIAIRVDPKMVTESTSAPLCLLCNPTFDDDHSYFSLQLRYNHLLFMGFVRQRLILVTALLIFLKPCTW
jgi:hypothetical protein